MKFVIYTQDSRDYILPVCEPCLDGSHLAYGDDHRLGEDGRAGCKASEEIQGTTYQCACNSDWKEFYDFVENGPEKIFDSEKKAKSGLESMSLDRK